MFLLGLSFLTPRCLHGKLKFGAYYTWEGALNRDKNVEVKTPKNFFENTI
jgi:hypothetical protein